MHKAIVPPKDKQEMINQIERRFLEAKLTD